MVPCRILRIIERAGHKMEFFGRTANLTAASLALAILRVDHTFEGMAFSIRSYNEGADPEVSTVRGTESQSGKHCSKSSFIYSLGGRGDTFVFFKGLSLQRTLWKYTYPREDSDRALSR